MIDLKSKNNKIGNSSVIENSIITQQIADVIQIDNQNITIVNQMPVSTKTFIIQEILEGILDLDEVAQPIELDITPYTIQDKIDYNDIEAYKTSFHFYMQESLLIEKKLEFLNENKSPVSSKKLYDFIKRIYHKHCGQENPDMRIHCICEEIKNDLNIYENISPEDKALIPSIVFYVFSKCHIFEKPPQIK